MVHLFVGVDVYFCKGVDPEKSTVLSGSICLGFFGRCPMAEISTSNRDCLNGEAGFRLDDEIIRDRHFETERIPGVCSLHLSQWSRRMSLSMSSHWHYLNKTYEDSSWRPRSCNFYSYRLSMAIIYRQMDCQVSIDANYYKHNTACKNIIIYSNNFTGCFTDEFKMFHWDQINPAMHAPFRTSGTIFQPFPSRPGLR